MTTFYDVLEILKDGKPSGLFRKVEFTGSMPPYGLCEHEHETKEEARDCPVVVEKLKAVFPEKPKRVVCPHGNESCEGCASEKEVRRKMWLEVYEAAGFEDPEFNPDADHHELLKRIRKWRASEQP